MFFVTARTKKTPPKYRLPKFRFMVKRIGFYHLDGCSISTGTLFHINWNIIPHQLEHRSISSGTTFHIIDNTPKNVEAMHKYKINEGGKMSDD